MNDHQELDRDAAADLYGQGRLLLESADLGRAVEALQKSMLAAPHFKTSELPGECLLRSGRYKEALVYLAAAVGVGRNEFRGRYLMARAFVALRAERDAVSVLRHLVTDKTDYKAARELPSEILSSRPELAEIER